MSRPLDSGAAPDRPLWPRKGVRIGVSAEITLRRTGHVSFRVKIVNISPQGCRAEFVERPKLDELVWVKIDGLQSLEAMVCWVRGFEIELEFERPIHPAVFEMLVKQLQG